MGSDEYRPPDRTYREIIFADTGGKNTFCRLDLVSFKLTPLISMTDKAQVVAYDPVGHAAIFYAGDRTSLRVWRESAAQRSHTAAAQ
jgi:hypothetical protein